MSGIVAAYLSGLADSGRKASTIGRRAAAIGYHHKMAGHEPPTGSEAVRAVLRGIRRTIGSAREGKAPATADILAAMLGAMPGHARRPPRPRTARPGLRRRTPALRAGGPRGRRPHRGAGRLRVRIRRSKTDQEGEGAEIAIPRGYRLRPVEAVQTWLAAAEISTGPVFRPVLKGSGSSSVPPRRVPQCSRWSRYRGTSRSMCCTATSEAAASP